MIEVAVALALLLALARSVRARFPLGGGCAALAIVALAAAARWEIAAGPGDAPALLSLGALFLGPTAVAALRESVVAWSAPAVVAAIAAVGAGAASRRSAPLRPESSSARALDAAASPFALACVLEASVLAVVALLRFVA